MPPAALADLRQIDTSRVLVDIEGIRRVNPQRFEMEQLTAIVHIDREQHIIIGYKDVGDDEFWARGHMPGFPLMPGVIICEAAAQLTAFYCSTLNIMEGDFLAFSGLENVRFRGPVKPGDRLVLVAKATRISRRSMHSHVQGFVNQKMVFEGDILGMPFSKQER
jgi:3-hydroxyacyl-[acyl-carrier-protein] dehydratase